MGIARPHPALRRSVRSGADAFPRSWPTSWRGSLGGADKIGSPDDNAASRRYRSDCVALDRSGAGHSLTGAAGWPSLPATRLLVTVPGGEGLARASRSAVTWDQHQIREEDAPLLRHHHCDCGCQHRGDLYDELLLGAWMGLPQCASLAFQGVVASGNNPHRSRCAPFPKALSTEQERRLGQRQPCGPGRSVTGASGRYCSGRARARPAISAPTGCRSDAQARPRRPCVVLASPSPPWGCDPSPAEKSARVPEPAVRGPR